MKKVGDLFEEYKDITELQVFATAQTQTIIELNKKLNEKDEEIKHLKRLVESTTPLVKADNIIVEDAQDEEIIARTQLNIYKKLSMNQELTLEETRKVEIYSKILSSIAQRPKKDDQPSKKHSVQELLRIVEDDDSKIN